MLQSVSEDVCLSERTKIGEYYALISSIQIFSLSKLYEKTSKIIMMATLNNTEKTPMITDEQSFNEQHFVKSLRLALPYMVEYQNKVFIIILNERIFQHEDSLQFIEDLLLLHRIGNKLIFIPDLNQSIEKPINENQRDALIVAEQKIWHQFQALWLKYNQKIDLLKNHLLHVRPCGVKNGKDFQYTATVQGIFNEQLQSLLAQKWALWIPSWGHSFAGIAYIVKAIDIALTIAQNSHCNKLIYLDDNNAGLTFDQDSKNPNHFSVSQAKKVKENTPEASQVMMMGITACKNGIQRFHYLNVKQDGALICELFTRDGIGLLVYSDIYDELIHADESCITGIIELVDPLSEDGSVLSRDKEFIEKHLDDFYVMRREKKVIACVALHAIDKETANIQSKIAEIACLVVHPEYQSMGIASQLMHHLIQQAKKRQIKELIALTVGSQGWFQRHQFKKINPQKLPQISRKIHDSERNSTVYYRQL